MANKKLKVLPGERIRLPQYHDKANRIKERVKLCAICGREFFGHYVRKFCDIHMDQRHGDRAARRNDTRKRNIARYVNQNQEINLKNSEVVKMKLTCALPGCGNLFEVLIYPRQSTVPKYCEAHRSEYRRQFFTRTRKAVSCNA